MVESENVKAVADQPGDRLLKTQQLQSTYDYIIVGAGSAGCVIARRLVEGTDASVLLLEAGGSDEGIASITDPARWLENIGSSHDWRYGYDSTPRINNRSLLLPRGKVLGGTGSINTLIWARGNRLDYDNWAEAGNIGWDYDSVLPLFKKSEDWEGGGSAWRGVGGPMHIERAQHLNPIGKAFIESGKSYGIPYLDDINVPEPIGVGPINMNVRGGVRCSTADAYLRPVLGKPALTVITGAKVLKLRLSDQRCIGLDVIRDNTVFNLTASQEVILSAGAIDTPRLLMLSGLGPQEELKRLSIPVLADLPGVGQNLQDHPMIAGLCFETKEAVTPFSNNLADTTLFWKSRSGLPSPDLMFLVAQLPYVSTEIGMQYPVPQNAFSIMPSLVRVESRGYLKMRTALHDDPLEIQPNFLEAPADVEALLSAVEIGLDIVSQPACQQLIKRWVAPASRLSRESLRHFLADACLPYFHPVGTCAMGSDKEAVVDAHLRVHGIEGLRIADASIMPTITSANTNAPTVMIAEFVSNLIVAGLGQNKASQSNSH